MAERDTTLYDLLGVLPSDPWETIHHAFRKLRSELHPDKGGDEELFKQLVFAYELLTDRAKRKAYDAGEIGPDGKPAKKSEEEEIKDVARQGLMQMLSQILEIDKPIFRTLLQAIDKHDQDAHQLIAQIKGSKAALERRMKNSIVFKGGGEDLLTTLATQKIDAWTKQIAGCERSLKIFAEGRRMTLELQKRYEEVRPQDLSAGVQIFQFGEKFDPQALEAMLRHTLGEPQIDPEGTTTGRMKPGYRSPYRPR